jgi:hypothetical protein
MFTDRNLSNITSVTYRVSSASLGGKIELHVGSPTGTLISTVDVPVTGSSDDWILLTTPLTDPGGKNDLYFVFKNQQGNVDLFDLKYDWIWLI